MDAPPQRESRRADAPPVADDGVAAGAENILGTSSPRVAPSIGAASPPPDIPTAAEAARRRELSPHATENLRAEIELELRDDRASMAAIQTDLASVHVQLGAISAGIICLQSHSLRQTGMFAFALAVLIAIAWKVVEG